MLLRGANSSTEISIARLVKTDEDDERIGVLHVQDAVLLACESCPEFTKRCSFDVARVGEAEPRPEDCKSLDRLSDLLSVLGREAEQEVEERKVPVRGLVVPDV